MSAVAQFSVAFLRARPRGMTNRRRKNRGEVRQSRDEHALDSRSERRPTHESFKTEKRNRFLASLCCFIYFIFFYRNEHRLVPRRANPALEKLRFVEKHERCRKRRKFSSDVKSKRQSPSCTEDVLAFDKPSLSTETILLPRQRIERILLLFTLYISRSLSSMLE